MIYVYISFSFDRLAPLISRLPLTKRIMAGVFELIRCPRRGLVKPVVVLGCVNPSVIELHAAREILAEVFAIRLSDVDEMLMLRSGDGKRWPERLWARPP